MVSEDVELFGQLYCYVAAIKVCLSAGCGDADSHRSCAACVTASTRSSHNASSRVRPRPSGLLSALSFFSGLSTRP